MRGAELTPVYGERIYYRVFVQAPGDTPVDVTFFRGSPTQVGTLTSTDPFGDASASLSFPGITIMDRPGAGDLWWWVPLANVDILIYNAAGTVVRCWEGYLASEDFSNDTQTVACKGAMFQADDFLAKPSFPQFPVPYELLIKDALNPANQPSLRTHPLRVEFPVDWHTVVPNLDDTPAYLKPWGVAPGEMWTGMTTRSTGGWDGVLTGQVQSLLALMHTESGGQWTISKRDGRQPVLHVREYLSEPTEETYEVYAGVHGVNVSFSRDFTQSSNVVFAQGSDLAGSTYSGMQVTSDGATTYYSPFSASPNVFPADASNARLIPGMMRKEQVLKLPSGIDEPAAREIAATQIRKFADPGLTGSIELMTDPIRNGNAISRFLIRAGDTIVVRGLRGTDVLFHVGEVAMDFSSERVTLTVDTKFRDAITIHEVRARTRDALDPVRLLQVGRYSNTIQDLIKPWSYTEGSGVIPSGGSFDATKLFQVHMPTNERFPWTETTKRYPPKSNPEFYIRVPARDANADNNWSGVTRDNRTGMGVPIKMAQSGSIRLSQIAAYDADGNLKPVHFFFGVYGSSGISPLSMPMVPPAADGVGMLRPYPQGQRYPLFEGAFEAVRPDGTEQPNKNYLPADGIAQAIAWGTFHEPAGYSPGRYSQGNGKTGMLTDETTWSFDTSGQPGFDKYSVEGTAKNPTAGMVYALVYCDDSETDTFFLGRFFRQEPGS